MSYIITENCINCKNMKCVEVCPTNCFNFGYNFTVINNYKCISCGLCSEECPVEAITHENVLSVNQKIFFKINLELSKIWKKCGILFKNKKNWTNIKNKLHLIKL